MGLIFVLLFWAVIGLILASISAAVFGSAVALATRGAGRVRGRAIVAAAAFPFACGAWAAVLFVMQALINEGVLHRNSGIGDTWHCPLPNGYQVMMIDVTDHGTVYNPKTQQNSDGVGSQADAVFGVDTLQVAGPLIFGGIDSQAVRHLADAPNPPDSYFVLDTRIGKRTDFSDMERLRAAAQQAGVALNLEPIATVYGRYRFSWFEVLVGALFVLPVFLGAAVIIRFVVRLRRRPPAPAYVGAS